MSVHLHQYSVEARSGDDDRVDLRPVPDSGGMVELTAMDPLTSAQVRVHIHDLELAIAKLRLHHAEAIHKATIVAGDYGESIEYHCTCGHRHTLGKEPTRACLPGRQHHYKMIVRGVRCVACGHTIRSDQSYRAPTPDEVWTHHLAHTTTDRSHEHDQE